MLDFKQNIFSSRNYFWLFLAIFLITIGFAGMIFSVPDAPLTVFDQERIYNSLYTKFPALLVVLGYACLCGFIFSTKK